MEILKTFFLGIFIASIVGGLWWLTLFSGVLVLMGQRSYVVLVLGVFLDLWFVVLNDTSMYIGVYTIIFVTTTVLVEFVRRRLLWAS